jgi:hypothetical protein
MYRGNYGRKSTISMKMFIKEFGGSFSEHMKERLMELDLRCFLTRKALPYRFDLKHVEHLQYEAACDQEESTKPSSKEYAYGQLVVVEGKLYFSESCLESNEIAQSPMVSTIYNALDSEGTIFDEGRNLKVIDDKNIDFVVDSILSSCPEVSQSYLAIVRSMISLADNK